MAKIDIYSIKRAVDKGFIDIFVSKNVIYASDAQSGEVVKIGVVKEDKE